MLAVVYTVWLHETRPGLSPQCTLHPRWKYKSVSSHEARQSLQGDVSGKLSPKHHRRVGAPKLAGWKGPPEAGWDPTARSCTATHRCTAMLQLPTRDARRATPRNMDILTSVPGWSPKPLRTRRRSNMASADRAPSRGESTCKRFFVKLLTFCRRSSRSRLTAS